jgi:hypothetical protein
LLKGGPSKIGPDDPCICHSGIKFKECHGKPFEYEIEIYQALSDLVDDESDVGEAIQRITKRISEIIDKPLWQHIARRTVVSEFKMEARLRADEANWKPTPFKKLIDDALDLVVEMFSDLESESSDHNRGSSRGSKRGRS